MCSTNWTYVYSSAMHIPAIYRLKSLNSFYKKNSLQQVFVIIKSSVILFLYILLFSVYLLAICNRFCRWINWFFLVLPMYLSGDLCEGVRELNWLTVCTVCLEQPGSSLLNTKTFQVFFQCLWVFCFWVFFICIYWLNIETSVKIQPNLSTI